MFKKHFRTWKQQCFFHQKSPKVGSHASRYGSLPVQRPLLIQQYHHICDTNWHSKKILNFLVLQTAQENWFISLEGKANDVDWEDTLIVAPGNLILKDFHSQLLLFLTREWMGSSKKPPVHCMAPHFMQSRQPSAFSQGSPPKQSHFLWDAVLLSCDSIFQRYGFGASSREPT